MAAAGDIPVSHLRDIRNGGGALGAFVLVVDGAIPAGDGNFCLVFDNNIGGGQRAIRTSDPGAYGYTAPNISFGASVTVNQALEWLAGAPGCLGVVAQGACSSYGGVPSGQGNKTGATGVSNYLASQGITTPVINVPGCPPHPDWTVYTVAYILAHTTMSPFSLAIPTLDSKGRPHAVFSGSNDGQPFCYDCPNKPTQGTPQAAQELGDAGCIGGLGCKGPYTFGDCPVRQKNTADDGTLMNWCVGAQGPGAPSGHVGTGIGEARHPCQGCIEPDFPDWASLTGFNEKTSRKIKGFYNE
jgi:hydrogenase small subunit